MGDRGIILATVDGGASWQLQTSGSDCSLTSVDFIDGENGRAAGGTLRPYLPSSKAVMLRTFDGGRSWEPDTARCWPRSKK